ncbi:MAG: sensor histidine kinase [Myxococcota bacterium]
MSLLGRAALIAGSYMVLATSWILASGAIASAAARDAAELEQLERLKGLGFVLSTGALLFIGSLFVLRRLAEDLEREAKARETMLQLERHSLAGLFVSSIAHDANNVATVIGSMLYQLNESKTLDADDRAAVHDADEALQRLQRLFADLKALGRTDQLRTEERDLVAMSRQVVELLHGHSLVKHCRVRVVADGPVSLPLIPALIEQTLINLIINAADATGGRGTIEVHVKRDGADALLEVHDDGPGVPAEQEAALFKAFKTTKPHGTGLGLLSVKECAARHEGSVGYRRSPLSGACFFVRLPLATPRA